MSLSPELTDAAKALGLLNAQGDLDSSWFEHAFERLQRILSNPTQRDALLSLLDRLAPPVALAGLPAGEKWHPLLGTQPRGNAYVTVKPVSGGVVVGLAGEVHGQAAGGHPDAALRVHVPLMKFGAGAPELVAGLASEPLSLDLRVGLALHRPGDPITLGALRVALVWSPQAAGHAADPQLQIVLEGLGLDDGGTRDLALTPATMGSDAVELVLALVRQQLSGLPAAQVVMHALGLLGVGDSAVPMFPFAQLTQGPAALQAWVGQVLDGAHLNAWLGHFSALFGTPQVPEGVGTLALPTTVQLAALGTIGRLSLTLARADGRLHVGVALRLVPAGPNPPARLDAQLTLLAMPLSGTGSATLLPAARVLVGTPGGTGDLLPAGSALPIRRIQGGVEWDGATQRLLPILELLHVTFQGTVHERIDLTHADAVANAANAALQAALRELLGHGQSPFANALLALIGLGAPASAPGWPHQLDLQALVSAPTRAIGTFHRAVLLHPTMHWGHLLNELASLAGLGALFSGAGTPDEPWRVPLAQVGPLTLALAAWNDTPGTPVASLRVGLRLQAQATAWSLNWRADVLGFDLATNGSADVRLLGGQEAVVALSTLPNVHIDGLGLVADSLQLRATWRPGSGLQAAAHLPGLALTLGATTHTLGDLVLPSPVPFDLAVPASLPLPMAALQDSLSAFIYAGLRQWAGPAGEVVGGLIGLHGRLPGLPTNWPSLFDPAQPQLLFTNPAEALRAYLDRAVQGVANEAAAGPHLLTLVRWLQGLLDADVAPGSTALAAQLPRLVGGGRHADPWRLPLLPGSLPGQAELLLWLDPDGAPPSWGGAVAAALGQTGSGKTLLQAAQGLRTLVPAVGQALAGSQLERLGDALDGLVRALQGGDGLVDIGSQLPDLADAPDWQHGSDVPFVAHHLQPGHASLIGQTLDQIATWAPQPAQRVLLLLHPAFAQADTWQAFLAEAASRVPGSVVPGAHFNLRQAGVDPLTIALDTVSTVAGVYTADLQDDGLGNHPLLAQQIDRIAARVAQLRPGAQLFIVAHSTVGIAARVFAASVPTRVAGLVTLGTPHRGAELAALRDPAVAQALRAQAPALPHMAAGPTQAALGRLLQALDGRRAGAAPGEVPVADVFPIGSFAPTDTLTTGGVPALALGSRLGGQPFEAIRQAWTTLAAASAGSATLPTHLGVGVQLTLGERPNATAPVRLQVRADLARWALRGGVPQPATPAQAVRARLVLEDPAGGYVLGSAQSHQGLGQAIGDVRLRRAELTLVLEPGAGGVQTRVELQAQDAAFHGPTVPQLDLTHPLALPTLGAAVDALFNSVAVGSGMDELADALQRLGVLAVNAQGRLGLSLDALAALQADAAAFLKPRLTTALSSLMGWMGLRSDPVLGYALPLGPVQLHARDLGGAQGWRLGVQAARDWNAPAQTTRPDLRLAADVAIDTRSLALQGTVGLTVGAVTVGLDLAQARVNVQAAPWLSQPLTLWPAPDGNALRQQLSELLPRFLLSSGASLMLRGVLGSQHRIAALDLLVADPAAFFTRAGALGQGGGGGVLDGTRLATLVAAVAKALGQAGPQLQLPGGFSFGVSGTTAPTFALGTTAPLGGVVGLQTQLTIDELLHPHPGGTVSLTVPAAGPFPGLDVVFGIDAQARVTLAVTPKNGASIQLLPQFSGFGALLAGVGQSLLPAVLDALNGALGAGGPIKPAALQVAAALNLYDNVGNSFAARAPQWGQLLSGGSIASITGSLRTAFLSAAPGLLNAVVGSAQFALLPGSQKLRWNAPAIPGLTGDLSLIVGWDNSGPAFAIGAAALKVGAAPVVFSFQGGYEAGAPAMLLAAGVDLQALTGIVATPGLRVALGAGGLDVRLRPFSIDDAAPLEIDLVHGQLVTASNLPGELATRWLLPLVTQVLVRATKLQQGVPLWPAGPTWPVGPTIGAVLQSAGLTDAGGNPKTSLPALPVLVSGVLQGLLSSLNLKIDNKLTVGFSNSPGKLGVRLSGHLPIPVGDYQLTLYAGETAGGTPRPAPDNGGLVLDLFQLAPFTFQPELKVQGLGLGFANKSGKPLVDTVVRLREVAAFLFVNARFHNGFQTSGWGFEADIAGFGLPLSQGMSGGGGGGNPVASSLLSGDGGGGGGDSQTVSPEVGVLVGYREGKGFYLEFDGQSGALWIAVQKQFGPIYIEQIGVKTFEAGKKVGLLLDGGVKVSGLAVQVDDLTLLIPITKLGDASQWGLDLAGMAVALEAGPVKLSGGLLKNFGPPVSYDGALMVDVCGRGFTAIGSYARPSDALGEYVSFFVFVSLPIPLGGPPYFFVLGLGGGVGLNRALLPPEDLNLLPSFPLVAAIDNSAFANDPMAALKGMGTSIPPKRGSFWLAAGLKFSTFALVNSTAVLYVALDRGLEIGLLGLSRMSLPSADFAIAQIELALKARFSTEEGLLSVQAQLTDRSYLFHPSCQLTGGFAFFLWFRTGRFVLTLGGYHKAFNKPADFPVVPRLGFRWSVSSAIVIKGENYFALSTTAVMAGGRLEASFHGGPVKAWFKAWLDVLVAWDPFYYMFDAGIEIGASVDTGIFGTVSVSLGANVHIEGPPLQGYVEVEILIVTVHIPFGDKAHKINYITDFNVFKAKYLTADDTRAAVDVQLRAGLLPSDPPGADPAPGTAEAPWRIGVEFAFESESTIASNRFRWQDGSVQSPAGLNGPVSLAPMTPQTYADVTCTHELRIVKVVGNSIQTIVLDPDRFIVTPVAGHFPEATWHWVDPRQVKAAANTIDRIQGLKVQGVAEFVRRSAIIQISKAVDDLPDHYALPLPFKFRADYLIDLIPIGTVASQIGGLTLDWSPARRTQAALQLLSQPALAADRVAAGLSGAGLQPISQRALRTRSAPPRVLTLATGLTLDEPGQAAPMAFAAPRVLAEALRVPRLLSVMRRRVTPTSDAPAALRTTVLKVKAAQGAPRMNAPHLGSSLVGARLHRAAHPQAAAPTRLAQGARTLLHPAIASAGAHHSAAFELAGQQIMGDGVSVPAGVTQLWQLPETEEGAHSRVSLALSGNSAVRVVWLDSRDRVISDVEVATLRAVSLAMPEGAARLALTALGRPGGSLAQRSLQQGAVSLMLAPTGRVPAAGWQTGMQLEQVGAHTLLGRGASLFTAEVVEAARAAHHSVGLIAAERAVADQTGVTTRLPAAVTVVICLLEQTDPTKAFDGDLAVSTEGAVVALPPLVVVGGTRRAVLYDVRATDEAQKRSWFEFTVASEAGWRLGGVIGLQGSATEWADRLDGDVPPTFIDDQALSADGEVRARFAIATDANVPLTTRTPA